KVITITVRPPTSLGRRAQAARARLPGSHQRATLACRAVPRITYRDNDGRSLVSLLARERARDGTATGPGAGLPAGQGGTPQPRSRDRSRTCQGHVVPVDNRAAGAGQEVRLHAAVHFAAGGLDSGQGEVGPGPGGEGDVGPAGAVDVVAGRVQ